MLALKDISFIDLYLGNDFSEIKGLNGATTFLSDLSSEYAEDAQNLKKACEEIYNSSKKTEFSIIYDTRLFRVTVICNIFDGVSYVIRQTPKKTLAFSDIPLTTPLRQSVEHKGATGLFLVSGEMGCGKTTTAASVLQHRIESTGCLGVSIEDPIETFLNGRHGNGRCMQLEVSQNETYSTATKKAWRTGASCLLLGEIRDSQTAHEVLLASLSMFVVSTIHASSVYEAIERYVMFCEEINPNAKQNISNTLYVIAHQRMTPVIRQNIVTGRTVDLTGYNLVNCTQSSAIKAKIAHGNYKSLSDEFNAIVYNF
ncbi:MULTISPECIES: ATPase, T2SS/T4P/T4SS family [Hafniaceae]|uniref:ATPase, T2SS/T4P/T4SS family n=1 Tax=Hafniaceae TaxID=1903412 RepID=UPI00061CF0E7|nr:MULTISPECIES: ATPase, T2SS/T4P/T4SS family [Hafniaceae]KKF38499.1 conjugal transfer protein [Hafnia alvei]MBW3478337.1 Flp pilus assembly complex ATPase component TadA [Hafnia alvei]MCE9871089.1 Flp pilus assembly complex ATPase component TadA [Hafnia alvei]MDX6843001.1 ATPase, T2SS/T4P/T4SS family [Hafnia paralvei]PNK70605.1 conjugal transfer protein [Hafnia paralvei]